MGLLGHACLTTHLPRALCSTPLEEVDPYSHLMGALAAMQAHMPSRYAAVVGSADAALQEKLHGLHAHVESEQQRKQQEQQQTEQK